MTGSQTTMTDPDRLPPSRSPPEPDPPTGAPLPLLRSEDLFEGQREVFIRHGDDLYRLRITRSGKLILHK